MPFNGSGSFTPLPPPDYPAVAGTSIIADYFNNVMQDVFDGLSNTLTRDGQSPAQTNLPMGGFKFTGAGAATANGQFLTWGQTNANLGTLSVTGDLTVNTTTLVVNSTTNAVGVGTSPGYRFHIFEPDTVTASAVIRAIAGQASRWIITANAGDPSSQGFHLAQNADRSAGVFNAASAPIDFSTNSTVRARIGAAGGLVIGAAAGVNPAQLLDVRGSAVIGGVIYSQPSGAGSAETLRVIDSGGFLSFFNTANLTRTGYIQGNAGGAFIMSAENATRFTWSHGGRSFGWSSAGMAPDDDNVQVLGTPGNRWASVYGVAGFFGSMTVGGNLTAGGNITASGNVSAANLAAGTHSPSISGTVNVSSVTIDNFMYSRLGNIVTWSVTGTVTTTAAVGGFSMSLPIASNFTVTADVAGTAYVNGSSAGFATANFGSDLITIQFTGAAVGAGSVMATGQYIIK